MQPANRFSQCLLEQKDWESQRSRRLRRWAFLVSVIIQAVVLSLSFLVPLFGRTDMPVAFRLVPVPPWRGSRGHSGVQRPRRAGPHRPHALPTSHPFFYPPVDKPAANSAAAASNGSTNPWPGSDEGPSGDPQGLLPPIGIGGPQTPPVPLPDPAVPQGRLKVSMGIQEAKLIHRVDPAYPALARQIRLEGTVVLRALIAKDGTVQSLEVVNGHPLFLRATLEAVAQWRYQPTLLSGEPLEVETLVTVIFRLHK